MGSGGQLIMAAWPLRQPNRLADDTVFEHIGKRLDLLEACSHRKCL